MSALPRPGDIDIIFSDVDGTLLDSGHQLHPRTRQAVHKLSAKYPKIPFVICSGKQYESCLALRKELQLADNVLAAHCQGAVVQKGQNGAEILKQICLTPEAALAIIQVIRHRAAFVFLPNSLGYINKDERPNARDWMAVSAKYDAGVLDFTEPSKRSQLIQKIKEGKEKVIKLTILGELEDAEVIRHELSGTVKEYNLELTRAIPEIWEVLPAGVSKGVAVKSICELYNTTPARAMCFGDGENDLTMFETLNSAQGYGVAMANAMEPVMSIARYKTLSNDEGGVGAFLEEVFQL